MCVKACSLFNQQRIKADNLTTKSFKKRASEHSRQYSLSPSWMSRPFPPTAHENSTLKSNPNQYKYLIECIPKPKQILFQIHLRKDSIDRNPKQSSLTCEFLIDTGTVFISFLFLLYSFQGKTDQNMQHCCRRFLVSGTRYSVVVRQGVPYLAAECYTSVDRSEPGRNCLKKWNQIS